MLMKRRCADMVLFNGTVFTGRSGEVLRGGVAIREGRILLVGSSPQVLATCGDGTVRVDLEGRSVIPGIVDSHNHVIAAGRMMQGVMCFGCRNMDELKERVRQCAERLGPGEWVEGGGWIECQFEEYRAPTRWDLDEAAPANPVVLRRLFGMVVANSLALRMAGIDRHTPSPPGGRIDRHPETGEPTGILRDAAVALLARAMPRKSGPEAVSEMERAIETALGEYLRWGITSVIDPGVTPLGMRAYQNLYMAGRLPLRVDMMPVWHGLRPQDVGEELDQRIAHLGIYTGFGDRWLRVGALKMAIDGGLGTRTAWCSWPFKDGTRSQVPLRLEVGRLEEHLRRALEAGWSVGIHTCGDRAQDAACSAFRRALEGAAFDQQRSRHNIIHGYFPTDSSLKIMADCGLAVSLQPGFIWVEGDLYFDIAPEEKLRDFKPIRRYLEAGVVVAANSDMTSAHYNPFLGMYAAVTRRTARGRVVGGAHALSIREALPLFTLNGAYLSGEEGIKGSLEPGKLADLAVLAGELDCPAEELLAMRVDLTVIEGRVVHDARGLVPKN